MRCRFGLLLLLPGLGRWFLGPDRERDLEEDRERCFPRAPLVRRFPLSGSSLSTRSWRSFRSLFSFSLAFFFFSFFFSFFVFSVFSRFRFRSLLCSPFSLSGRLRLIAASTSFCTPLTAPSLSFASTPSSTGPERSATKPTSLLGAVSFTGIAVVSWCAALKATYTSPKQHNKCIYML